MTPGETLKNEATYIVAGPPCVEMFAACDAAKAGQVVLSPRAHAAIKCAAQKFDLQVDAAEFDPMNPERKPITPAQALAAAFAESAETTPVEVAADEQEGFFARLTCIATKRLAASVMASADFVPRMASATERDYDHFSVQPAAERLLAHQAAAARRRTDDKVFSARAQKERDDSATSDEKEDSEESDMTAAVVNKKMRERHSARMSRALAGYVPPPVLGSLDPRRAGAECSMRDLVIMFIDLCDLAEAPSSTEVLTNTAEARKSYVKMACDVGGLAAVSVLGAAPAAVASAKEHSALAYAVAEPDKFARKVDRAFKGVISAARAHGATLRQFVLDDKGFVAILVLGLPPDFHEDGASRAMQVLTPPRCFSDDASDKDWDCLPSRRERHRRVLSLVAMQIASRLQDTEKADKGGIGATRIGITSGRCFCGPIGLREAQASAVL